MKKLLPIFLLFILFFVDCFEGGCDGGAIGAGSCWVVGMFVRMLFGLGFAGELWVFFGGGLLLFWVLIVTGKGCLDCIEDLER